jgi:hypothetical protein
VRAAQVGAITEEDPGRRISTLEPVREGRLDRRVAGLCGPSARSPDRQQAEETDCDRNATGAHVRKSDPSAERPEGYDALITCWRVPRMNAQVPRSSRFWDGMRT